MTMFKTASLVPLGLAAVLFAAPVSAQAVASASVNQEQAAFVLNLNGLTAANSAKVQARFAQVPTVTAVTVDAATGKVALTTGAGIQLDADAAKVAVQEAGLTFKSLDIPAWAAETVWVVQVTGGS
jgi:hypothetical protein